MYTSFFGLSEKPFAITPDPRYLFMSERHAEALAHLLYGVSEAGGFMQLTGEVGTGKTTVVRSLLERIPKTAEVALVLNPQLTPMEFLLTICEELGIFLRNGDQNSSKDLVDVLNSRLLEAHAKGRRVIVIVDEAQNLSYQTLEQVRLLTNLETVSQKLLQIILIGQPELRDVLARTDLRQLAQRITGRYHLNPLSSQETAAYVTHRLKVAGAITEVFTPAALKAVHRLSGGIPRLINIICDRALLGGFTSNERRIGSSLVRRAAAEVQGDEAPPWNRFAMGLAVGTAALLLSVGIWLFLRSDTAPPSAAVVAAVAKTAAPSQPPVAAPPNLGNLLRKHADRTSSEQAFAQLFSLWDGQFEPRAAVPCEQASAQGLRCLYQKGSWGQLRSLNRPAILTLIDDAGGSHQVVVDGLTDTAAQVDFGGVRYDIPLAVMSRYWFGDYLILWRPMVAGERPLSLGMRGDEIRWLRRTLSSLSGLEVQEPMRDEYDEELARMVADFQRQHRLDVDGIAGVQTQVVLDTLLDSSGSPMLVERASGG